MPKTGIIAALDAYDAWLGTHCAVLPDALARKRVEMAKDPFRCLRGTAFRFAAQFPKLAPDLARLTAVPSCGDAHLQNFGTWRDAEGRLVWGVNDLDEAALLPWPADLVRLCTSAILARQGDLPKSRDIAATLLRGYVRTLPAPLPFVLDEENAALRAFVNPDATARARFWDRIAKLTGDPPPPDWQQALVESLPPGAVPARFTPREAGLGSLGRPRFVVIADWAGGRVVREAKARVPSAWLYAGAAGARAVDVTTMAHPPSRVPDPWWRVLPHLVVRRLAPDSDRLRVPGDDVSALLQLLESMGAELGNLHGAGPGAAQAAAELRSLHPDWLRDAAKAMAAAVEDDHAALVAHVTPG